MMTTEVLLKNRIQPNFYPPVFHSVTTLVLLENKRAVGKPLHRHPQEAEEVIFKFTAATSTATIGEQASGTHPGRSPGEKASAHTNNSGSFRTHRTMMSILEWKQQPSYTFLTNLFIHQETEVTVVVIDRQLAVSIS